MKKSMKLVRLLLLFIVILSIVFLSYDNYLLNSNNFENGYIYQHTYLNREYEVWRGKGHKPNVWKLRNNSSTILVEETSENIDDLEKFRKAVNDVNSAEKDIIIKVGGGAAVLGFTTCLSGGTATIIVSGAAGVSISNSFIDLKRACRGVNFYYYNIENNCQN